MNVKEGQFQLEDLFGLFFEETVEEAVNETTSVTRKKEVLLNAEDYLSRGTRLISLAKEKFEKVLQELNLTDMEKEIYSFPIKHGKNHKEVYQRMRCFVGRYLAKMETGEDVYAQALRSLCGGMLSITVLEEKSREYLHSFLPRSQIKETEKVIRVVITEQGKEILNFLSVKNAAMPVNRHSRLNYERELIEDARSVIAMLIMYHINLKSFRERSEDVYGVCVEHLKRYHFYEKEEDVLSIALSKVLQVLTCGKMRSKQLFDLKNSYMKMSQKPEITLLLPADVTCPVCVRELFMYNAVVVDAEENYQSLYKKEELWRERLIREKQEQQIFSLKGVIAQTDVDSLLENRWFYFLEKYGEEPKFADQLICATFGRSNIKRHILGPAGEAHFYTSYWIVQWFSEVYQIKNENLEHVRKYLGEKAQHAKSFEDKKNIPQKTLEAMKASTLNHYFGYVEYDADVDLSKVRLIEDEFMAVKETYFPQIDCCENAIRFRKLGNHKAVGLYYPFVKCLCVDYRYPHSMIHEFGHLIDYQMGNVSHKGAFVEVRELYEKHLKDAMGKDSFLSKKLNGSGKYNLSYYLDSEEVFARAFEVYCLKVLHIQNDLLQEETNLAVYPYENETYLKVVTAYFHGLFSRKDEIDETAA